MSVRDRVVAWAYQHQQAVGVGLVFLALALIGIAAFIGWAVFAGSPPTADLGPSSTPEPSSAVEPSDTATPTLSPSATAEPATGWTPVEINGIGYLYGIAEHDGRLLAAGTNADLSVAAMATSDDGMTWTPVDMSTLDPVGGFFSAGAGASGFISVVARYPITMGIPELSYLYSDDGRTWHEAVPPAACFAGPISAYDGGFIGLGGRCRTEGDFAPSALHVLTSSDGRSWSSRIDEQLLADSWATDGHRLVLFQHDPTGQTPTQIWISDDAAESWHMAATLPASVSASGLLYGHGRYRAPGSWLVRANDPDSAVCASVDGETWDCRVIPPLSGELAGRHWLARSIAITPTGYASLVEYPKSLFAGGDPSTEMVAATSVNGLHWDFELVPELSNKLPTHLVWTSYGLFSWGGTNPNLRPGDISRPYIDVYRAALP